jgi:hypothetical protein
MALAERDRESMTLKSRLLCRNHGLCGVIRYLGDEVILSCGCRRKLEGGPAPRFVPATSEKKPLRSIEPESADVLIDDSLFFGGKPVKRSGRGRPSRQLGEQDED